MTITVFVYILTLVIIIKNIKNLAYSAIFTALMVAVSVVYIPLAIPITLQTFVVFLALLVLGGKMGSLSVLTYILLGLIGLPVFSGFKSGFSAVLSPTGGYIIGLLAICITYMISNCLFKGKFKKTSLIIGTALCYLVGSLWYMAYSGENSFLAILSVCVFPFIIPDLIKLFVAKIIADKIKRVVL